MRILPDGTVEITNKRTKETKIVKPVDLPNYGIPYTTYEKEVEAAKNTGIVNQNATPTKLTADQIKQAAARENSTRIIKQLEDAYFRKQNDPTDDMSYGRLGGLWQSFLSKIGYNPDLRAYQALVESDRPTLARAAGDVGNLSETEQKAAIKILPNQFSTSEEAKKQFKLMKEKFGIDLSPKTETKSKSKFTIEAIE